MITQRQKIDLLKLGFNQFPDKQLEIVRQGAIRKDKRLLTFSRNIHNDLTSKDKDYRC